MQRFNQIASALFDWPMAPFGHDLAAFALVFWPLVMGVLALQAYKLVSDQKAIAAKKRKIGMHLLEIRLFRHDIAQVLKSTGMILYENTLYVGNSLIPMVVLLPPMVVLMAQLVAHYAYAPTPVGAVRLLRLELDPAAGLSPRDVSLDLPEGVALDAPPVRTADGRVFWRLRAEQAGDHALEARVGELALAKGWAVGGEARKVPLTRLRGWEALLYPGESALPADSPVLAFGFDPETRTLAYFPDGESGILLWTLVASFVAGLALKDLFGVTF